MSQLPLHTAKIIAHRSPEGCAFEYVCVCVPVFLSKHGGGSISIIHPLILNAPLVPNALPLLPATIYFCRFSTTDLHTFLRGLFPLSVLPSHSADNVETQAQSSPMFADCDEDPLKAMLKPREFTLQRTIFIPFPHPRRKLLHSNPM